MLETTFKCSKKTQAGAKHTGCLELTVNLHKASDLRVPADISVFS